jgi:mannose-6-phosphate isomerase-like protein (cupin superfamily)
MKIPLEDAEVHDKGDFVASFYLRKKDNLGLNALLVDCKERHYRAKLHGATRTYIIVEGTGTFTIDGIVENAKPYDCFVIQSGQVYEYAGRMKLLEINVPPTDRSNEERLE